MSMSISSSNIINIFNNVTWTFNYIILPICFILGNIGNCLNLILFSQRSSRSNSCLLYFLSASIINIFILNFALPLRIIRGIWNIDPGVKFLWFCRWRTYFTTNCFLIYRYSILLACIDRMCASSRKARIRLISQPKVAYRLIAGLWIFITIYFITNFIFPVINFGQCLIASSPSYATYTTVIALVQGICIPLTMIVSGLITIHHIKLMKKQVTPLNTVASNEQRRVAGQFLIMLFVQVTMDCLCNITQPCYLAVNYLIYPALSTLQNGAISSFILTVAGYMPFINYSAGFYLYTLSSPTFRQKFFNLLRRNTWFQRFIRLYNHQEQSIQTIPMVKL